MKQSIIDKLTEVNSSHKRDILKYPYSKREKILINQLKRGRGIVKAKPLEEYLWLLKGTNKLDKLVEVSSIYVSKPTVFNLNLYFFPTPRDIGEKLLSCSTISHFIQEWQASGKEQLYWTDEYKDVMFVEDD